MKNIIFLLLFTFLSSCVYAASKVHSEPQITKINIFGTFIEPLPKVGWNSIFFRNTYFTGKERVKIEELSGFLEKHNEEAFLKFNSGLQQYKVFNIAAIVSIISVSISFLSGRIFAFLPIVTLVAIAIAVTTRIISDTSLRRGLRIYNSANGYGNVSK